MVRLPRPSISLKARALGYLSRREYSRAALMQKLAPHAQDEEELAATMQFLLDRDFLSDARFVESFTRRRAEKHGKAYVVQALRQHGVEQSLVDAAVDNLAETEFSRGMQVWQKKFGGVVSNAEAEGMRLSPEDRSRQMRFLLQRGFSVDIAKRIVDIYPNNLKKPD